VIRAAAAVAAVVLLVGGAANAQVILGKTSRQTQAPVGTPFSYDLSFTVGGAAQQITILDPLPDANHTLLSVAASGSTIDCVAMAGGTLPGGITVTCNAGGGTLRLDVPAITRSGTVTVTYRVAQPETSVNQANALCGAAMTPCATSPKAQTQIVAPSFSMGKTGPPTARAGSTIVYMLTLSNPGAAPLSGATVDDALPTGAKLNSVTAGGATYKPQDLAMPRTAPDGAVVSLTGSTVHLAAPTVAAMEKL
jgi:uncharacterized repeat protein (TIGR01451 family)